MFMLTTIACNYTNRIEYVLLYGVRFIFSGKIYIYKFEQNILKLHSTNYKSRRTTNRNIINTKIHIEYSFGMMY